MGSRVTETYRPVAIAANSTVRRSATKMGGMFATAAGTLTVSDEEGNAILDTVPVAVGWNELPFFFDRPAVTFTTASDAAGYLAI